MCSDCKSTGEVYPSPTSSSKYVCSACYGQILMRHLTKMGFTVQHLESRYRTLVSDPDALEQWKGVCGFAACIHEILKMQGSRMIRNLFEATFHDLAPKNYRADFLLADNSTTTIPLAEIIGYPRNVYAAIHANVLVDWCLCRALTHILNVKDSSRYNREATFSDQFSIPNWKEEGHYAAQTDSVAFVARSILGLKVLWVLKHAYVPTIAVQRPSTDRLTNATASLDQPQVGKHPLRYKPFDPGMHLATEAEFLLDGQVGLEPKEKSVAMFAAINTGHILGWWTNPQVGSLAQWRPNALSGPDNIVALPFNHWVIIDEAVLDKNARTVKFGMWTWHTRRYITYSLDNLNTFIREAIFVKR